MTEKRFTWDVCEHDAMFYDNGAVIDYDDVVDLLNNLHKENIRLQSELELEKGNSKYFKQVSEEYFEKYYELKGKLIKIQELSQGD